MAKMGRRKARTNSRPRPKWHPYSCRKMRFETRSSADMAAELQGEKHGTDLSSYKCDGCLGFHLTSR